jgi:hypothetical protein
LLSQSSRDSNIHVFQGVLRQKQALACQLLSQAILTSRISNAYLFVGNANEDKWDIVRQLACYFNCLYKNDQRACILHYLQEKDGNKYCQNCQWIIANQHPHALLVLDKEGKSQIISVDKVRKLSLELVKRSEYLRICVIADASLDAFGQSAANALLKVMEEPPTDCLFILLAESKEMVLPTVVSRSQVFSINETHIAPDYGIDLLNTKMNTKEICNLPLLDRVNYLKISQASLIWLDKLRDENNSLDKDNEIDLLQQSTSAIDQYIGVQYKELLTRAAVDMNATQYLNQLLSAGNKAKEQLESFVKPQAVLESFSFTARELAFKYWGEVSFAES